LFCNVRAALLWEKSAWPNKATSWLRSNLLRNLFDQLEIH
jgi:hypothetical protein